MTAAGMDASEALVNSTIGLIVSAVAVVTLWPLFGWDATAPQSVAVSIIFWALSTARSFIIRRVFRCLQS